MLTRKRFHKAIPTKTDWLEQSKIGQKQSKSTGQQLLAQKEKEEKGRRDMEAKEMAERRDMVSAGIVASTDTRLANAQCRENYMEAWGKEMLEKEELQQQCTGKVDGEEKARDGKARMGGRAKAKQTANKRSTLRPKRSTEQHGKVLTTRICGGENLMSTKATTTMLLLKIGVLPRDLNISQ